MKKILWTLLLLISSLSVFGQTDTGVTSNSGKMDVGLSFFPFYQFNIKSNGPEAYAVYGTAGKWVTDRLVVGFRPFIYRTRNIEGVVDLDAYGVDIYGRYYIYSKRKLGVFADMGTGLAGTFEKYRDINDNPFIAKDLLFTIHLGTGFEYRITPGFNLEIMGQYLRYNRKFDLKGNHGFIPTLGFKFRF